MFFYSISCVCFLLIAFCVIASSVQTFVFRKCGIDEVKLLSVSFRLDLISGCVCVWAQNGQKWRARPLRLKRHGLAVPIEFDLWQFHACAHVLYAAGPCYFAWMFSNRTGMAHVYLDDVVEYVHADWFRSRTIGRSIGTSIFFLFHHHHHSSTRFWFWKCHTKK